MLLHSAEVAIFQLPFSQKSYEHQGNHGGPSNQVEFVDHTQGLSLKTKARAYDIHGAATRLSQAR